MNWCIIGGIISGVVILALVGYIIWSKMKSKTANFNSLPNTSLIYDLVGVDKSIMTIGQTSSEEQCQNACASLENCLGYTWLNSSSGTWSQWCYGLQNKNYSSKDQIGAASGWKI